MKIHALVGAACLAAGSAAFAAGGHDTKPQYGGIVQDVRDVSYELVARPDVITIYVDDHGKKVSTVGATAKATPLNGAEKTEVALTPGAENRLEAKGSFKIQKGTRVIALVILAGKPPATTRYEIK